MSTFQYKTYKCVWFVDMGWYLDETGRKGDPYWRSELFPTKKEAQKELERVASKTRWDDWRDKKHEHSGYNYAEVVYKELLVQ